MHYELQTLVMCQTNEDNCHDALLDAAKDIEKRLKAAGVGFVVEVRDIRRGSRLFRSIDAGSVKFNEL